MKHCCYCKRDKDESEFLTKKNGTLMSRCSICYHKEKECKLKRVEAEKKQLRPASVKQQRVFIFFKIKVVPGIDEHYK